MWPVEPRPDLIGTTGLPSRGAIGDLRFFPKRPAASDPEGVKRPPVIAPSAARKERRFQANFKSIAVSFPGLAGSYLSPGEAVGLTTRALPTISISAPPGNNSTAIADRARLLAS